MRKLPRTLRLDPSDSLVFARSAEPGEWAVTGSFLFGADDLESMPPKMRAAFRSGFLGIASFGFATLVEVAAIAAADADGLAETLAGRLLAECGAPDYAAARAAAQDELAFAASLCEEHEPGTVIAMRRTLESGAIREEFRTLRRRAPSGPGADRLHAFARAFEFIEIEEEEAQERVDLLGIGDRR
jgi:hypothetical protein